MEEMKIILHEGKETVEDVNQEQIKIDLID